MEPKKTKQLQDYILAAVCKMIKSELGYSPLLSQASDYSDAYKKIPSDYRDHPHIFLKLTGIEVNTGSGEDGNASDSLRPHALTHSGIIAGVIQTNECDSGLEVTERAQLAEAVKHIREGVNGGTVIVARKKNTTVAKCHLLKPLPVTFTYSVSFETRDTQILMDFLCAWAYAAHNQTLAFNLRYLDTVFPIAVNLSQDLSVEDRTDKGNDSNLLQYEGEIRVSGFMTTNDGRYSGKANVVQFIDTELHLEV